MVCDYSFMALTDKASKLILPTALFTLAGSIVFVSGTGLAQGATSTDKAISTLKTQIKNLQARVQTLEDSPELLQGESGPQGPQGPQGERGATGATGATGTMSGLKTKSIDYLSAGWLCSGFGSSQRVVTDASYNKYSTYSPIDVTTKTISGCTLTVYTP
jgi:hypothetical protein